MNPKTFNELMIAVIVIGFAIVIIQNQIIINKLYTETPLDRLMKLPEMQAYRNYTGTVDFLSLSQVAQLAKQYPSVYGNITTSVYRVQLYGDKNLFVLYDDSENKIVRMFEMMTAEMNK